MDIQTTTAPVVSGYRNRFVKKFMTAEVTKNRVEALYRTYNRRRYVNPDPLEFLYGYDDIRDREIVALIASSLAYGKVAQILKSVSTVLGIMGESPYKFITHTTYGSLEQNFHGFVHRFARGNHLAALLWGARKTIIKYGSLNNCLVSAIAPENKDLIPAISFFAEQLCSARQSPGHLVARPQKGSACKRMNLFLRWMVRKDRVDPGGWQGIPRSRLIIPLDTHMHNIGLLMGFTRRKQADMRTALEITAGFKKISPRDPVKYDFTLTRFGIRDDMDISQIGIAALKTEEDNN
jgi:uncharacterized protein (TIGR02757 family)